MIRADFSHNKPATLEQFHTEITQLQMNAHGEAYCAHHHAIRRYINELGCTSYKELGVFQGATAANACLIPEIKKITLVDMNLDPFKEFIDLFETFCEKEEKELDLREMSSLDQRSISDADLLFIDSYHQVKHLRSELRLHSESIAKGIVFHDINKHNLLSGVKQFVTENRHLWSIREVFKENTGFAVIVRK